MCLPLLSITVNQLGTGGLSEIFSPIIFQLGTGGVSGFFIGYAIKKLLKVLAAIIGLFSLAVAYLGYIGILNVNYQGLAKLIQGLVPTIGNLGWITPILSNVPFAGSLGAGVALGLKMG